MGRLITDLTDTIADESQRSEFHQGQTFSVILIGPVKAIEGRSKALRLTIMAVVEGESGYGTVVAGWAVIDAEAVAARDKSAHSSALGVTLAMKTGSLNAMVSPRPQSLLLHRLTEPCPVAALARRR